MADVAKHAWTRVALVHSYREVQAFREVYGFAGNAGFINLEGQLLRSDVPARTVYIFMHPTSTLQLMPMPAALAAQGLHVLCAASRYPKNDSALIMEKVAIDMGAWVRYARETLGYTSVILVGWSGGGSLSLFYQAEAEKPTITQTPAGDPVDLKAAALAPADGVIFIAAHLSRAETLTEWIDPSVIDELDPDARDLEFDIYNPRCPNKAPFTADFVAAFRAAQIARNRRITSWSQDLLETLKKRGTPERERGFVVHRTMCDVRWIDKTVDPNGRRENWCYLGDPETANTGPVGLARFSSLRSWISQWSIDLSQAKGPPSARRIHHTPVLQIENGSDDAVPATHNPTIRAALATPDKEFLSIPSATHYYVDQPNELQVCINAVIDWSRRHSFL